MKVKGTGPISMLVAHVQDNYYAMFHNPYHHSYRETHLSILSRDVKF